MISACMSLITLHHAHIQCGEGKGGEVMGAGEGRVKRLGKKKRQKEEGKEKKKKKKRNVGRDRTPL